ncbi:MAG: DUF6701 domain-containing protein [Desulfurivibrionaceae bacterium]
MPTLYQSFAGNVNFVGTQKTLRTGDNTSYNTASSLVTNTTTAGGSNATTATLSGLPSSGTNTIRAAYLYWAGSGVPDNTVTFEGGAVTASRQYTITDATGISGLNYFSGVADVTAAVAAKGNGTYTLSGLRVSNSDPWYSSQAVMAGWALLVIYENPTVERFRVLNIYEGFQPFYGSNIPLTISNFRIPASNIDGRLSHLTWEGDVTNSSSANGYTEQLTFKGNTLSDANNPANNQFNSVSTIRSGAVDSASYGIDFDAYDVSAYLIAGDTTATSVYSSGADLVLLSMEVISVTNTPVADLGTTLALNGLLMRGQNATYTVSVNNNGPNSDGPITVTDTLPAGLSFVSGSGTNWSCTAVGQTVTCSYSGSLASGVAAPALTLTTGVSASASGTITNSATVAGTAFDNVSGNNTATDSHSVSVADLALSMTRNGALVVGQNGSYTLNVSNSGPISESGPITVTDTMPTGLSYVSSTGTGWTCAAASQTVTCTYSGSIVSGASAPALTLTVSVSGSGAITNSATVAGYQYDNNLANNTATDTYTVLPSLYAYYAMDETTWNGTTNEVQDSSGNGHNADRLGTATTTDQTTTFGHDCRGAIVSSAAGQGVNTKIDVNSLGNAGTITFWYRSNAAWNDGNDRMLFDASNELGNGNADKHFYLVKPNSGRLMFALEDSNDTNSTATSATAYNYAANTWHHIAVTWNIAADRLYIYLDGDPTPVATSTTNLNGTLGNTNTLYLGAQRFNTIAGTPSDYTTNSANGIIDEVRIYNSALSGEQIAEIMAISHACAAIAPDHLLIEHDGSAISCSTEAVVVKACANADCSSLYTSGVTGNLTAGGNSVAFTIPSGQSQTTVNIHLPSDTALADPQTVRLGTSSVSPVPTGIVSPYCSKNAGTPDNTIACDMSVYKAGFLFDVPNLTSGTASGTVNISAVRSSNSSTCVPLFQNVTRTVALWGQYQNPASGTLPLKINGSDVETTATTPAYTSTFSLAFNNTGVAALTSARYDDVGLMQLNARYLGSSANTPPDAGMIVTGSDTFVVKPDHFDLSGIQQTAAPYLVNPAAVNAVGNKFVKAGEQFSVTVTAKNALGNTTLNYGKETIPESVKLTSAVVTGLGLTHDLTTIGGSFGTFTNGVATGTTFTWDEVGIITLTAYIGDNDYLGALDLACKTTTDPDYPCPSSIVGRFYPDHFSLGSGGIINRSDVGSGVGCLPASIFTYMGEPMKASFTLTAQNASNGTTENYAGNFAKFTNSNPSTTYGVNDSLGLWMIVRNHIVSPGTCTVVFSSTTPSTTSFSCTGVSNPINITRTAGPRVVALSSTTADDTSNLGSVNFTADVRLERADSPDGPYPTLNLGVAPQDKDGVTLATSAFDLDADNSGGFERKSLGTTEVRFGRLVLQNAYGTETEDHKMPFLTQYFDNTKQWLTNGQDSCTALIKDIFSFGNYLQQLASTEMGSSHINAGLSTLTTNSGKGRLYLTKPSGGDGKYVGSVDVTALIDTTTPPPPWYPLPWLLYEWDGLDNDYNENPTGRVNFGIYRGNDRIINWREIIR